MDAATAIGGHRWIENPHARLLYSQRRVRQAETVAVFALANCYADQRFSWLRATRRLQFAIQKEQRQDNARTAQPRGQILPAPTGG